LSDFINSSGAWLGALGLVFSLSGLYFSIIAMRDLRHIINTYDDFAIRLTRLIKNICDDNDRTNFVRIMAYNPFRGALGLRSRRYEELRDLMLSADAKIEIICLDENELSNWFDGFVGKRIREGRRVDQETVNRAKAEVEELIYHINNPALRSKRAFATLHPVLRGSINELPKFYAYFTNDRAIIVNPLFNPIEGLSGNEQPEELRNQVVELIGFETTDTYTIRNLLNIYDITSAKIRKHVPVTLAS